jgi:hypothetical protein
MYTELVPNLVLRSNSVIASVGSAAVIDRHIVMEGMNVERFLFVVTTAVVSGSPVVIALKQRSGYGVTAGQITVATLTIPGGAAVGQTYYKDVDPIKLVPGQELVAEVTAAGTSGNGIVGVKLGHSAEMPGNSPGMIASV